MWIFYIGAMKVMNCFNFFQNFCKAHIGNLVKIENAVENWFLKSVVKGKYFFFNHINNILVIVAKFEDTIGKIRSRKLKNKQ